MNNKFDSAIKLLNKHGQEHLLSFYDELNNEQKEALLDQILCIDFEQINMLYKNSFIDTEICTESLTHLPHINKSKLSPSDITRFKEIGIEAIKSGEFAVVTLSGGARN